MEKYCRQGNSMCQIPEVRKVWHNQGTGAPRVTGAQRARTMIATRRAGRWLGVNTRGCAKGFMFYRRKGIEETQEEARKENWKANFLSWPFEIILAAENPRMGFQSIKWPWAILGSQGWCNSLPRQASGQGHPFRGERFALTTSSKGLVPPPVSFQEIYCRWRPSKRD